VSQTVAEYKEKAAKLQEQSSKHEPSERTLVDRRLLLTSDQAKYLHMTLLITPTLKTL